MSPRIVLTHVVAMGCLPARATAIVNSIDAKQTTSDGTPTEDALNGIRPYCTQYIARNPTERYAVQLTTASGTVQLGKIAPGAAGVARAWHYDREPSTRRIVLFPDACRSAQADPTSRIDVILGCLSEPVPE